MLDELHSDELEQIDKKRELLEQLLAFTKQINHVAGGLDLVREMAKPSQRVNKRLFKLLLALIERLGQLETEALKSRLQKMDDTIKKELSRMMVLSRMSETEFMSHFAKSSAGKLSTTYETLQKEISNFRRMAQTNAAIRYILAQRGALIDACTLPISQKALGETVESLRLQEAECKSKVERKIEDMIADTELILSSDKYPEELKAQLHSIRDNLTENLTRLRAGEPVSEVFISVGAYELGDQNASSAPDAEQRQAPDKSEEAARSSHPETAPEDNSADNADNLESSSENSTTEKLKEPNLDGLPHTFIGITLLTHDILTWLRSPWGGSWRAIRAKSGHRSEQYRRK
jgi:hypothetical protein